MPARSLVQALDRDPVELVAERGFAAVAAVFSPGPVGLELLLIERAHHPSDPWSGHLALPGGRVELTDTGPLAAAVRETSEEIGLSLQGGNCLGQLDDLAAVGGRPGLVIRPFVFALSTRPAALSPNREVRAVHRLSLAQLLANEGRGSMPFERGELRMTLPCVDFEGGRLWGLTLRMVDDLLDRIDHGGIGLARIPS